MSDMPPPSAPTGGSMEPHRATMVFVLGLLSLILCSLCGPFAWRMGKADLAKMDAGQMDPEGKGLTKAGFICGIIGCVVLVLQLLYVIFIVLLGGLMAAGAAAGAAGTP
ncbi:MAG: hypothetical protein R3B49_10315 [Phycisphaerales bacterium]